MVKMLFLGHGILYYYVKKLKIKSQSNNDKGPKDVGLYVVILICS
jgi:hypothetical protein